MKLISLPYLINQTSILQQPHKLTNYLEDICSNFHSFWNKGKEDNHLRMINLQNKKQTITKLLWVDCFRIVLKKVFHLIGIQAREHM